MQKILGKNSDLWRQASSSIMIKVNFSNSTYVYLFLDKIYLFSIYQSSKIFSGRNFRGNMGGKAVIKED